MDLLTSLSRDFLSRQNRILEQIAAAEPLESVLTQVVLLIESEYPGVVGSVLVLDHERMVLRSVAGPHLPPVYHASVDGIEIGPMAGSCGTATFFGRNVFVEDIQTSPLWMPFRELAAQFGLRSCWSTPIKSRVRSHEGHESLGAFALYRKVPGMPDERCIALMEQAEFLACVAIEADRTAKDLRLSLAHHRSLFDACPIAVWEEDFSGVAEWFDQLRQSGVVDLYDYLGKNPHAVLDAMKRVLIRDMNQQALIQNGARSKEELLRGLPKLFSERSFPTLRDELVALWQGRRVIELETITHCLDGRDRDLVMRIQVPGPVDAPQWDRVIVTGTDITQRKAAERMLAESEERFRQMAESIDQVFWLKSLPDQEILYVSPAYESIWGRSVRELYVQPRKWLDAVHPDDQPLVLHEHEAWLADPLFHTYDVEYRIIRPDGSIRWVADRGRVIRNREGQIYRATGMAQDITAYRMSQDKIREAQERNRLLVESVRDYAMFIVDLDGRIQTWNSGAERIYGYTPTEIIGQSMSKFLPPETPVSSFRDHLRMAAQLGRYEIEGWRIRRDGSRFWANVCQSALNDGEGRLIGIVKVVRDLTERRHLEDQLRQAQKMEAIGRLAGGIAHDFNNLLAVINGFSEMTLNRLAPDDPNRPAINAIYDAGWRAAELTKQMLAYSRRQILEPMVVDVNEIVARSERMLRRLIGEPIRMMVQLEPDLPPVKVDPSQLEQVIMNLVLNARDAMPKGGQLSITTRYIEPHKATVGTQCYLAGMVQLDVVDTGVGIPEDVKEHLFEPFFTTKGIGQGTGLGLATVYGIVQQSGGSILVESQVGAGSTFTVLLPAHIGGESIPIAAAEITAPRANGSETILLVEDEDSVRKITRLALDAQGFHVIEASSGEEAIQLAEQHAQSLQLLLTDLVMPGISGRGVADALRKLNPNIRVLFMSGYTDDAIFSDDVIEGRETLLRKPFTLAQLMKSVRNVLDNAEMN